MTDMEFVQALAREAGRIQLESLRTVVTVEHKLQEINLVTAVDRAIDDVLVGALRARFPQHAIISEEGLSPASDSEHVWYVDPLDGTTNYAHAYPVFAVSIGLRWRGEMLLGVVYDPTRAEMFSAERGAGAWLNGQRLRVSKVAALQQALLSTGFPYDRVTNPDNNFAQFARLMRRAQSVRRSGSAALDLAHIAAGRLDGHWERGLGPWDGAAASLLIAEAGGRLSDRHAQPWWPSSPWLVATNALIHDELLEALA